MKCLRAKKIDSCIHYAMHIHWILNFSRKMETIEMFAGRFIPCSASNNCCFNVGTNNANLWRLCNIRLWWSLIKSYHAIYTIICCSCSYMDSSMFYRFKWYYFWINSHCIFFSHFFFISRMLCRYVWNQFILLTIHIYSICYSQYSNHLSEKNCENGYEDCYLTGSCLLCGNF